MTDSIPLDLRYPSPPFAALAADTAAAGSRPHQRPAVLEAVKDDFSIRHAEDPDAICALCDRPTGTGPVGHSGDRPVCDLCLLEGSSVLGMVLALVAVVRAFGSVEVSSDEEHRQALAELGAFARIYERFAAKSGPARRFLPRDRLPTH